MSGSNTPAEQPFASSDPSENVIVIGQQPRKRLNLGQRDRGDRQVLASAAEVWQGQAHSLRVRRGFKRFDTMGR